MGSRPFKGVPHKKPNLAVQALAFKRIVPDSDYKIIFGVLHWKGKVMPDSLTREYTVSIRYTPGKRPKVVVLDPDIVPKDGRKLPHIYEGDELCLYHPKYGELDHTKLIAEYILPWLSEWLFHYEIWEATGEWMGGGEHPRPRKRKKRRAS